MNSYGVELKRIAYTYVKDWGKAEDLTQEVFVTCYEKLHTFQGNSNENETEIIFDLNPSLH